MSATKESKPSKEEVEDTLVQKEDLLKACGRDNYKNMLVKFLFEKFEEMSEKMEEMKGEFCEVTEEMREMKEELVQVRKENAELRSRLDRKNDTPGTSNSGADVQSKGCQKLLIGSSILRDLHPKIGDTEVVAISGARISDIEEKLKKKDLTSLQEITIQVGTNDCRDKSLASQVISSNYLSMIDKIIEIKPHETVIRVSSVTPMTKGGPDTQSKVEDVNDVLRNICHEKDCLFIDNDRKFKNMDGEVLPDLLDGSGFHLSVRGNKALLAGLGLPTDCFTSRADRMGSDTFPKRLPTGVGMQQRMGTGGGAGAKIHCFNCGVGGHIARNCNFPVGVYCYRCGEAGHISNMCHY